MKKIAINTWGTGRKDYSKNVEYSTIPIMRSHQRRNAATVSNYSYYSLDWPYVSAININTSPVDSTYTGTAADNYNLYTDKIYLEVNGDWLVNLAWVRYNNYGEYLTGSPITQYGTVFGYGRATLKWTEGLFWDATQEYCDVVYWNVIMDNPYPSLPRGWPPDIYTINIQVHQLQDIIAGPVIAT